MCTYTRIQILEIKENCIIKPIKDPLVELYLSIKDDVKIAFEQKSVRMNQNYPIDSSGKLNKPSGYWRNSKKSKSFNSFNKYQSKDEIASELNKLTKMNFKKISNKIIGLLKDSDDLVKDLLQNIFLKAIVQERYCYLYAKICFTLIQYPKYREGVQNFLLEQCDTIIQNYNTVEVIDDTIGDTEYDIFCKKMKEKKKSIGCFQFIAELYKLNLITKIKFEMIIGLLLEDVMGKEIKSSKEHVEKLCECICCVFRTVGYKLEVSVGKDDFDRKYIEKLRELSKNRKLFTTRIRFMFMDCIERKKWSY